MSTFGKFIHQNDDLTETRLKVSKRKTFKPYHGFFPLQLIVPDTNIWINRPLICLVIFKTLLCQKTGDITALITKRHKSRHKLHRSSQPVPNNSVCPWRQITAYKWETCKDMPPFSISPVAIIVQLKVHLTVVCHYRKNY